MNKSYPVPGLQQKIKLVCKEINRSLISVASECGFERKAMFTDSWSAGRIKRFCEVTGTDANWLLGIRGPDLRRNYESSSENKNHSKS